MKNSLIIIKSPRSYFVLSILFLISLSSCADVNESEREACEKSGGEYVKGFGETEGAYWYCKCPFGNYPINNKICKAITQSNINKCKGLSTSSANCDDDGYVCKCVWDELKSDKISYAKLTSDTCDCRCRSEICNCVCNIE